MIHIGGPCGLCGEPPSGYALIGDVRYCHGDWDESPTCYERASQRPGSGGVGNAEKLRDAADSLRTHPLTVHPSVADALARWLDDVAAGWVWDDGTEVMTEDNDVLSLAESMDSHALTIANLFHGDHDLGQPSARDHALAARVLRDTAHGMLSEQRHLRVELLPGWLAATNRLLARANTLDSRADRMSTTPAPRLRVPEPDSEGGA